MNSTTNIDRLIHLYEKRVLSKNFVLDIGYLSLDSKVDNIVVYFVGKLDESDKSPFHG